MSERILTIDQAAEIVPLSLSSLYREAPKEDSPFRKRAGRWLTTESDLVAWVRSGVKPTRQPAEFPMPRPRRAARGTVLAEVEALRREQRQKR